jgi:TPR repeat protein
MRTRFSFVVLCRATAAALLCSCLCVGASAQTGSASPEASGADALYKAQQWADAARAYDAITKREPANGQAWYRLGHSLHGAGRYAEAAEAYRKCVEIRQNPVAMYNLACAYARLNDRDKAFEWLEKSAASGVATAASLVADEDLAGLRGDARFKAFVVKVESLAHPCAGSPESREFDFWVGEWDVFDPTGQKVGSSSVQRIVGDCVIFENWTDAFGGSGKSFNYRNGKTGAWQQTWVDDKGTVTQFLGAFKDGRMHLQGDSVKYDGTKATNRMTFFNLGPDKVRQLGEGTADGGKTWTVSYDLTYVRRK